MPPAPVSPASPEIDGFLNGLIESKVLDAARVRSAWDAFEQESLGTGVSALAEFLVERGLLTPYQAERGAAGGAGKLQLGPYLLLEPLGGGPVGSAFLARHRGDRRRFAVKVLPLRSLWKLLQAKKQAVRLQALPAHPTIVPLAEIDTANGSQYLSWPFVEGETLQARLQRTGPLGVAEFCRVFSQVSEGLAICHAGGLFHGMLGLGNILLGLDGRARLLDLGVGAILAENLDDEPLLDTISLANAMLEMMDTTAPETISNPSIRNAAADAYSLGCVMQAALTGSPPFPEGEVVDKMIAHQSQAPAPVRLADPTLPAALGELIQSLLQKEPRNRSSLRDVKARLDGVALELLPEAPATEPFGRMALELDDVEGLLQEALSAAAPPEEAFPPVGPPSRFRTAPDYAGSEGRIDFDAPVPPREPDTPLSLRPTTRIGKPLEPYRPPPDHSGAALRTTDTGTSVPELLMPEVPRVRTLSLPTPALIPMVVRSRPDPPTKKAWEPPPAPVNWVPAAEKREGHDGARPAVVLPPAPQFGSTIGRGLRKQISFWKPADTVQLSVFGAPEVAVGQRVHFLVYAHAPEAHSNVATLCRAMRPDTELLGGGYLDTPVRRGTDIGLHLALTYAGVAKSLVQITWIGQTQPRTFEVFVPWESPLGLTSGVVTAGVEKSMVASIPLHFVIANRQA